MPRKPIKFTNEEILCKLRFEQEYHHRRCREYFSTYGLLILPLSLPVPQVYLEQVQDSCNKSTAIYYITPRLETHSVLNGRDSVNRSDMTFLIYEQWFRNHHVDIDFGKFVTKPIRVQIASIEQRPTVEDIIKVHRKWCEHVEVNLPLCSPKTDSTGTKIDDPPFEDHGAVGINRRQNMYYKLRPLFRALVMIVDDHISSDAEKIVHLIRTNLPSELSAPITFGNITPKLESNKCLDNHNNDLMTTTLSAAIAFITTLESREEKAFPEHQRDLSVIDERGADPGYYQRRAESMGYTGAEIRSSPSSWVKLAEGEDMLPPLTPGVSSMTARRRIPYQAMFAKYAKSERRLKYQVGCEG